MALFSKLQVIGIPFEDENWEDPSIHGLMTLFLISIGFGILLSIAPIYQNPHMATWLKFVLCIPCFYGIYAIISFIMRWKNAVFTSKVYLLQLIICNIAMLIAGQMSFQSATLSMSTVWSLILGCLWLIYLYKSHNVAVRFPKNQRKIYVFDWIAAIIVLGMALLTMISVILIK